MKRYIIMAGLLLLAAACTGCGKKEKADTTSETSTEAEEVAVTVLDNDQVTLIYNGYDAETVGLLFTITNKTDMLFNIYFNDVVVNGETLQPMFGYEVDAGTTEDQICLVDCQNALSTMTGIVCLETSDGEEIGRYAITDVALSDDGGTEESYAVKDGAVTVLDNDRITVSYIGLEETEEDTQDVDMDTEDMEEETEEEVAEQGFVFEVYNKSDDLIQVTFDSILVNGTEEEPSYIIDVMGKTFGTLTCDVSDVNGVSTLTAQISVCNTDGDVIDTYTLEDVTFK